MMDSASLWDKYHRECLELYLTEVWFSLGLQVKHRSIYNHSVVLFSCCGHRGVRAEEILGHSPSYQASSFDRLIKLLLALPHFLDDQ